MSPMVSLMFSSTATLGAEAGFEGSATPIDEPLVAAAELAGGTRLGRYVVHERLGAGGMGVVHAAYDPVLDRRVAVKLLRADRSTEDLRARLLCEARAMARLSHPNVMPIYDVGVHGRRVFIAMELVRGSTLRRRIDAATPWREVIGAYLQAARGLAAAHAAGLVHRDFKPDNVLCGEDGRVRVADFGLAGVDPPAARGSAPRFDADTVTGAVLGTPRYMAPEASRGEPVDARADQFSFCVSLFEALFDAHPYAVATPDERAGRARRRELARPARRIAVPRRVQRAIARGLSARPEDRHPSMTALADALERAITPRRRWPWLALAGTAGTAGTIVALALALASAGPASRPAAPLEGIASPAGSCTRR
jgi:eukaryotic-like serine/threonine-protein kinase